MIIVQNHKIVIGNVIPPLPPDQHWFEKWKVKCKLGSVQMIINIDLREGRGRGGGGGGAWFSIYRRKFDVRINCTPVVPVILARIVAMKFKLARRQHVKQFYTNGIDYFRFVNYCISTPFCLLKIINIKLDGFSYSLFKGCEQPAYVQR